MKIQNTYTLNHLLLATGLLLASQMINAAQKENSLPIEQNNNSFNEILNNHYNNNIVNNQVLDNNQLSNTPNQRLLAKQTKNILEAILNEIKNNKERNFTKPNNLKKLVEQHQLLQKVLQTSVGGKIIKRQDKCQLVTLFAENCNLKILKNQIYDKQNNTLFRKAKKQKWTHGGLLLIKYKLITFQDCLSLGEYEQDTNKKKNGLQNLKRFFDKKFRLNDNEEKERLDAKAIISGIELIGEYTKKVQTKNHYFKIASALESMITYASNKKYFFTKEELQNIVNIWGKFKELQFNNNNENENKDNNENDDQKDEYIKLLLNKIKKNIKKIKTTKEDQVNIIAQQIKMIKNEQ